MQYTFLGRRLPELEVLPAAERYNIGVVPWSPLDGGLLGGNFIKPTQNSRSSKNRERAEKHRNQLEKFSALCKEIGENEDTVALAWLLANLINTAPIIGVRTLEQMEKSLRAVEVKLNQEVLDKLDEIFPGPSGQIPEVYAW